MKLMELLLPSNLSEEETTHTLNLMNLIGEYSEEHVPLRSRMSVNQFLVLNLQCILSGVMDYKGVMHIARYITTMQPHPDKSMRLIIDGVLSGEAEQLQLAREVFMENKATNRAISKE